MQHTHPTDVSLTAWLTRLDLIDGPATRPSPVDGLARWLGWADAIPLAAALQPLPAVVAGDAFEPAQAGEAALAAERDGLQVQARLARAIDDDADVADEAEFPAHRQRCQALQQRMAAEVAAVRARVRALAARASPALARLAAIDAVMAQALSAREHSLLAVMPALLERHFVRLQQAAAAGDAAAVALSSASWLQVFRQDTKQVLRAELALRLQPVQGLVDALHAR